jgi:hypothetical protein
MSLQNPPAQYDMRHVMGLIRELNALVQRLNAIGPLHGSTLNLSLLPTSAAGLAPGDVYADPVTGALSVVLP